MNYKAQWFYFGLLFLFLPTCNGTYFSDCQENHADTCQGISFRYTRLEEVKISANYELPPLMFFENIIQYSYSGNESVLLRVMKVNNRYLLQLIKEESRMWDAKCPVNYKVIEKILTKEQEQEMLYRISDFKCTPCDLDRDLGIIIPGFSLVVKMSNELKVFTGVPYDVSMDKEGNEFVNHDKVKILDFIGYLLRIGGGSSETIYYYPIGRAINDSIDYQIHLSPGTMIREEKVYIDGQLLKDPFDHRIAVSDTTNLRERIKIIATEWDNVVIEY